jgi:hypothetical protein
MTGVFLTELEVSHKTKISLATLRRWRLEKRGQRFRKFGFLVRYRDDDFEEWMNAQPYGGEGTARIEPKRKPIGSGTKQPTERPQLSRAVKSRSAIDAARRQPNSLDRRKGS